MLCKTFNATVLGSRTLFARACGGEGRGERGYVSYHKKRNLGEEKGRSNRKGIWLLFGGCSGSGGALAGMGCRERASGNI